MGVGVGGEVVKMGMLGNGTFKDGGVTHNGGYLPLCKLYNIWLKMTTSLIEESINTNGNSWGEYFKENEYLKEKTMNTRLSK